MLPLLTTYFEKLLFFHFIDKSHDFSNFSKYVVNKGSICVNGISLTIAKYGQEGEIFTIAIIPHTWHNTNLIKLNVGDSVNLEADALLNM